MLKVRGKFGRFCPTVRTAPSSSPRAITTWRTRLGAHLIDLPTLEQASAYGLLEKIIGNERVSAEAAAAESICEQLEYLPLALEIVAQRLYSRPRYKLATFAEQLAETASRLDPLTMGDRAVRASFELSWQMLSEKLQRIFAGLAVFEGRSFSAEAMAYILELGELEMVDGLEDLRALSLVGFTEAHRYRQHQLLRQYAHEKLVIYNNSDDGDVRKRFYSFYLDWMASIELNLKGANQAYYLGQIDIDLGHVRLAWDIAVRFSDYDRLEKAADCMGHYFRWRGRHQEGRVIFGETVKAIMPLAQKRISAYFITWQGILTNEASESQSLFTQAYDLLLHEPIAQTPRERAFLLPRLRHDAVDQEQAYRNSIEIYDRLGDDWAKAAQMIRLGYFLWYRGRYDEVELLGRESLEIQHSLSDKRGIASSLKLLGSAAISCGQPQQGEYLFRECLEIYEEMGDQQAIITLNVMVGWACFEQGKLEQSSQFAQQGLHLQDQLARRKNYIIDGLIGRLYVHTGNIHEAWTFSMRALAMAREDGNKYVAGVSHLISGEVLFLEQKYAQATNYLEESYQIFSLLGHRVEQVTCLVNLVIVAMVQQQYQTMSKWLKLLANCVGRK